MFGNKTGVNLHGEIVLGSILIFKLFMVGKGDIHIMGSDLFQIGLWCLVTRQVSTCMLRKW